MYQWWITHKVVEELRKRVSRAVVKARDLDKDGGHQAPVGDIAEHLLADADIVAPEFQLANKTRDSLSEFGRVYARVIVPISGNTDVLPQNVEDGYLRGHGTIEGGYLFLRYQDDGDLERYVTEDLGRIPGWQSEINSAVARVRTELRDEVSKELNDLRAKLHHIGTTMEKLKIPLRKASKEIAEVSIPLKRRESPIVRAPSAEAANTPEYHLAHADYQYILDVLGRMVDVMARTPATFARMSEPELRDILLVILNSHYEPGATGETFNGAGKTDILLKFESKAAFIGECKLWKGARELHAALDQLFGYTTWYDTKCALLVFADSMMMTQITEQVPALLREHPGFVRSEDTKSEVRFRSVFHHPDDKTRELTVTVMVFPVRGQKEARKPSQPVAGSA